MTIQTRPSGFTLIELSIVLVIIGLIAAGVLFGKDMILASQTRAGIAQIEQYKAAVQTFRVKYNCIPGDCLRAEQFGLGTSANPGANGNGNGLVNDGGINGLAGGNWLWGGRESANFWYHLLMANLISDPVTGFVNPYTQVSDYAPKLKFSEEAYLWAASGTYGTGSIALGNQFLIVGNSTSGVWNGRAMSAPVAYYVDSKMDDGLPLSGMVRDMRFGSNYIGTSDDTALPACAGNYGCDLNGCGNTNRYDIVGTINEVTDLGETPYNPGRVECSLSVGKAW